MKPDIREIARRAALDRTLYMGRVFNDGVSFMGRALDEALLRAANAFRALRGAPCR